MTFEDFCREAVYHDVEMLYRKLREFADNPLHHIEGLEWFNKHSHIAIVCDPEPDEEEQDC